MDPVLLSTLITVPRRSSLQEVIVEVPEGTPKSPDMWRDTVKRLDELMAPGRFPHMTRLTFLQRWHMLYAVEPAWTWEPITARVAQLMPRALERGLLRFLTIKQGRDAEL